MWMFKINGHPVNLIQEGGQWRATFEDIPGISATGDTAIEAIDQVKKLIDVYDETMNKKKSLTATTDQHAKGFLRTRHRRRWNG
jgi:predicted RNase H-like HicB family nuclease